ncbi:MAG: CsbD family protein [Sphingobium sp.]|uniref:CsbD family protein n=1 Tax=Sphingobium sp. TaxID=1912891 RepID=UPI000DB208DC|nr:CsbD family protein [Sphingobium sp.]PZU14013.1 MAG: CsbD family protein [Sphingobium sp.]
MNGHRIEGELRQIKGSIREAIGKITGDRKTQAEGAAEKMAGKVQANAAKAGEAIESALKK